MLASYLAGTSFSGVAGRKSAALKRTLSTIPKEHLGKRFLGVSRNKDPILQ